MQNLHEKLSDSQLYKLAQDYGLRARQWLRKFEGLLPEIARRKLYKRHGCSSIHEFAAKLGGMSHEKVDKILRLAHVLENKPALKELLESGAASYCKIEKVAFIATRENEKVWAEKVLTVPKSALELCVQEARKNNREEVTPGSNFQPEKMTVDFSGNYSIENSALGPADAGKTKIVANTLSIKISAKLEFELRLLKQKLEKERGEALGFAEVLQELLKVYKASGAKPATGRAATSQKIIALCPKCIKEKENEKTLWGVTTRAIPQNVQDVVTFRQANKCAFDGCTAPPKIFHHTRRFALQQNHDPDFIVHLCVPHERLLHAGLIENEGKKPSEWRIKNGTAAGIFATAEARTKFKIDEKVNVHRREPHLVGT